MINKQTPGRMILFGFLILLLAGCNASPAATEYPQPYPGVETLPAGAYPYPYLLPEMAYPEPYVWPEDILDPHTFVTPAPGTATMHGILVVTDHDWVLPNPDNGVYLVAMPVDQPVVTIPQFVPSETTQADVDEQTGEFVINGIQPGQYAIVVLTTRDLQVPARYYDGSGVAIVRVKEEHIDQTIELGYFKSSVKGNR